MFNTSRRRWRAAETSTRPLELTNFKKTKGNRMRRSPLNRLANRRNLFSILPMFSFNALNRNCYSSNGDLCTLFSPFRSAQGQHLSLILFYERLFLLVFSILSFSAMKYSSRIFSLNFSLFLHLPDFATIFSIF